MNKDLLEIHSNTKDWLKFAESKNAMLVAFNAASIYGVSKLPFLNTSEDWGFWDCYFSIVIILLITSVCVCLISFVPRVKFMQLSIARIKQDNSVLFFEHLGKSTPKQILRDVYNKTSDAKFSELDEDLATQIHSTARVASSKYSLFTVAVWITIIAYVSPPIAIIFFIYNYRK
ncbi:Pycsar system effector family protein [Leeuwenhoekiella marinoflava]|uniref:Pycsar system effector family protein n=1 Tax=Leeuwenhoekiella marinoflava TaxID=988 RepID=UPI00300387E8